MADITVAPIASMPDIYRTNILDEQMLSCPETVIT
jgi:hypothetical protein